jgi:hypothetical protein
MVLDDRERNQFVAYCRQQAASCKAMAEQLSKMPGMPAQMLMREKQRSAAYHIVAEDLNSVSSESIG